MPIIHTTRPIPNEEGIYIRGGVIVRVDADKECTFMRPEGHDVALWQAYYDQLKIALHSEGEPEVPDPWAWLSEMREELRQTQEELERTKRELSALNNPQGKTHRIKRRRAPPEQVPVFLL